MTPADLGAHLVAALDGADATASVSFGQLTVDVPAASWHRAAQIVRDDPAVAGTFFDWLSGYDDQAAGFAVVVHVWSTEHRHQVLLRTRVPRDGGRLPTLTDVWPGAGWHERETFEMFGVGFDGHPNLVPLLLPEGFEGHPLRKDFVLAARVAKAWPGANEPGESDRDVAAPGRRRLRPPGVPAPDEWGPRSSAQRAT